MRLFADTNIVSPAVRALRGDGHDVVYAAKRASDPGDAVLLAEAFAGQRIFITKDHDIGTLVFRVGAPHGGVLLIDDLGKVTEEVALIRAYLLSHGGDLAAGAFLRASPRSARIATS